MTTITIDRAVVEQALEVLEHLQGGCTDSDDGTVEAITVWCPEVIDALKAALAQEQAEPVQEPEPVKHEHQWFYTGGMEPGQMRCIHCGKWGKETFE